MKFTELLEVIEDITKINVVGGFKSGLVDLYNGKAKVLKDILKTEEVLDKYNWGQLYDDKCFLKMEVKDVNRGSDKGLFIFIKMPDTYEHKDINGNPLKAYVVE